MQMDCGVVMSKQNWIFCTTGELPIKNSLAKVDGMLMCNNVHSFWLNILLQYSELQFYCTSLILNPSYQCHEVTLASFIHIYNSLWYH